MVYLKHVSQFFLFSLQEFVYLIIYSLKMAIACIIAGVVAVYHASIMATCVS